MGSSLVRSGIKFEKWELDVDDNEAPTPDPFDLYKNDQSPQPWVKKKSRTTKLPHPWKLRELSDMHETVCPPAQQGDTTPTDTRSMSSALQGLQSLSRSLKILRSLEDFMHATSPTVATQVVFEKRDLDIDDIEAPLPDPFDYVEEHRGTQSSTKQNTYQPEPTYIDSARDALKKLQILQEFSHMLESPCSATNPQILFEKWELDVDDCEAPIPDPFELDEEPINRGHFVTEANGTKGGVFDAERQNQNADDQVNNGRQHERSREAIEDQQARKTRKRKRQSSETGGLRAGVKEHESERRSKRTRWAIKKKLGIGPKGDIRTVRNLPELRLGILRDSEKNLAEFTRETTQREGRKQLFSLATECEERNFRTPDVGDLSGAIDHLRAAVKATPQDHPDRAACLNDLGLLLSSRYDRIGAIEDLHQAIEHATAAVGATPQDHPDRAGRLNNLGNCISSRYNRIGAIEDLHQAIEHATAAVGATPQDHPDRASALNNLSAHISSRYNRIGAIEDLNQAIEHAAAAVGAAPQDHPYRAMYLSNLSNRISSRYERIGATEDLHQAIEHATAAVGATPQDHPNRAMYLSNLSSHISLRYGWIGAIEDLNQAIEHAAAAVGATPQDHPDRAMYLSNLGNRISSRYNRIGAIEDLHQAIEHATAAVGAIPQDHPKRAMYLCNLGNHISSRYDRIGAIEDLHQAIEHAAAAVGATPQDHPKRAMYLSNLGNRISSRYDRIGAIEDLHQAIEHAAAAVGATPQDHPKRAMYLSNLSAYIYSRYERIGATEDLHQAIEHIKMASASTPQDHPNTARFLKATAGILARRFVSTRSLRNINLEDARDCLSHLKAAWDCISSEPSFRIALALEITRMTHLFRNFKLTPPILEKAYSIQELSTILESAVLLLPQSSPRSLQRQDHQYNLLKISRLAGDTASYALAAEKPAYHALKLLELSRGIIMGFAIDCRGDLSELKEAYPHLANKFNELRTEIDAPLPESNSLNSTLSPNSEFIGRAAVYNQEKISAMQRREKAIKEMEETIIEIRNLPGHEEFQLPPSSAQLMAMAKDGPIVAFVSSELQSDAIIITSSTIKSIRLSELLYDEIPNWRQEIGNLTKGRSNLRKAASKNKRMRELLLWLWKVAVRPVLDDLQLITHSAMDGTPNSTDDADLPHIWWIGVGPLSMAPFHAAGDYSSNINLNENTMSYAISSYIPTIKSLSYAREKNLTISSDSKSATRLLLVAMPTTPGNANLDVDTEVAQIVGTVLKNESASVEYLEHPCAEAILDNLRLRSYQVIHFSCHGVSDEKDPSSSHLVLVKDGRADKLTVQDIASRNTQGAQIAYLSACSTADNSAIKLADETIHIASGFQLAGFSHVLAAMWPAESGICTEISTEFYRTLFDSNNSCEGHRKVRIAFHKAARKAQKTYWKTPLRWAQYIHIGA